MKLLTEKQLSDLLKEAFLAGWKCARVFDDKNDLAERYIEREVAHLVKKV